MPLHEFMARGIGYQGQRLSQKYGGGSPQGGKKHRGVDVLGCPVVHTLLTGFLLWCAEEASYDRHEYSLRFLEHSPRAR